MFDTPMREIVPFIYKKGGKVSIINKSTVKKKKMKQKQKQKQTQIVNIYNTKPVQRKRTYKKEDQQQRMPVYYTQPQYTQYLPAPTITMPTRLPTMTPETKLPTTTGLSTGLKTTRETGTSPEFDAAYNDYMNDKQIYEREQEEIKRKNKDYVDFLSNGDNYQDEALPNFNYGREERLPPPPPPRPPQQEVRDPSEFNEYPEEEIKEENKQDVAPSLNSDLLPSLTNDLLDIDAIKRASKNHTTRKLSLKKAQDTIMSMDLGIQLSDLKRLNATEINWYVDYLNSRIKDANRGEGQKAKGRPRKPK